MEFDPTKPVSDKTVGGYPVQITERGQMLFGKVTDTDGITREICWNIKGESPALNDDFNLVNTPAPAPVPIPAGIYYSVEHDNFYNSTTHIGHGSEFFAQWNPRASEFPTKPALAVDWDKPVRWKDSKAVVERIGTCTKRNGADFPVVKWTAPDGDEHCMEINPYCDSACIENVPPPSPRTITVEVAACKYSGTDKRCTTDEFIAVRWPNGFVNMHSAEHSEYFDTLEKAEDRSWKAIGPWQTLTLPLKGDDHG